LSRLGVRGRQTTGNFPRRTPVRDLYVAFKLPFIYDYITKLYKKQAKPIQNHENANVCNIGKGEHPTQEI
jgi:hypothetical protein